MQAPGFNRTGLRKALRRWGGFPIPREGGGHLLIQREKAEVIQGDYPKLDTNWELMKFVKWARRGKTFSEMWHAQRAIYSWLDRAEERRLDEEQ